MDGTDPFAVPLNHLTDQDSRHGNTVACRNYSNNDGLASIYAKSTRVEVLAALLVHKSDFVSGFPYGPGLNSV